MSRPIASESVFQAVAHPDRRRILDFLRQGDQTASGIREQLNIKFPSLSQHLRILSAAGLIKQRRQGRWRLYSMQPQQLQLVWTWLSTYRRFWNRGAGARS